LNQIRVRLPKQVVLTKHARSLDLFDEKHTRPDWPTLAGLTSSLSAKSADKSKQQLSRDAAGYDAGEPQAMVRAPSPLTHSVRSASRLRALSARIAPQKENQCQES
jgi:hypothetical protein